MDSDVFDMFAIMLTHGVREAFQPKHIYPSQQMGCFREYEQDQVRNQHKERAVVFLSKRKRRTASSTSLPRWLFRPGCRKPRVYLLIFTQDYFTRYKSKLL